MTPQPPAPAPANRTAARWGLLFVTLAMGAALIVSALVNYAAASNTAQAITRDSADRMGRNIRREVFRYREDRQAGLSAALEDMQEHGLRFVGFVGPAGELLSSAGAPLVTLGAPPLSRREGPQLVRIAGGERVRVWFTPRRGPRGEGGRGPRRFLSPEEREATFVMELEPVLAKRIMSRALLSFLVNLAAAAILLLAAIVFWRLSRSADRFQAQLARDEQLKALGQMSAVLGHEVKNPLAALKGHAQLLVEQLDEQHPGRRGADTVVREATRIEKLTKQILDFAKTGQVELEPVEPEAMARSAVERAGAEPVSVDVEQGLGTWSLDRARMEQVLTNLLDNARQASDDGAPIELSLGVSGDVLVIEVSDRGEGLHEGDEDKIFEPFHTTRTKGSGLGLALARRVVDGHGGRISAARRPGGGARFRIELPRA